MTVLFALLVDTGAAAQSVGPVASYAFSEAMGTTTADVSGNGNAGTLIAPSPWTTSGRYGNGLLLAGGLQGVRVASAASLNVSSALTIESWIYPTSIAAYPKLVYRDGAPGSPYNLALAFGNGTVVFGITTTAGSFNVFGYTAVAANTWSHVAATYDGATMRVYVNGVLFGSAAASGTIVEVTRDLWLGRAPWGEGFTGRLDEVRVYDRALSPAEIARDRDTQVNGLDPPDVGDLLPASSATGIAPTSPVRATFSKPMDAGSIAPASFYLSGPSAVVAATVAYDPATRVATLTPSAPLAKITTYTAHITTDVGDLDEGNLRARVEWTFTTSPDPALAHAAYAFNEGSGSTAADSSANGNTATLTGASGWTTEGKFGNALALGGGTDGARIAAAPSLQMSQGLTLEAWVYPTSIANYPKLIWRDGVNNVSPYNLQLAWGNGSVGLSVSTINGTYAVWAFRAIVVNMWTHVAATYDGSVMRIFINGQLVNAVTASGSILPSIRDLWVGRAPWGEGFTGTLDDVRIYDRARSPSEIANDMMTPATEITPPAIRWTAPLSGQSAVDPTANIVATFDEGLAAASVNGSTFELHDSAGTLVTAAVTYDGLTQSAVLDPAARLSDVTTYTATLGTGVTNAAGIPLQDEYSWAFTTADTTPPSVIGVAPAAATRNVSLGSDVRITFSEPLDPASVSADTIQLRDTRGVPVAGTATYDAQLKVATFVPAAALLPTRPYTATVVGGVAGARWTIQGRCGRGEAARSSADSRWTAVFPALYPARRVSSPSRRGALIRWRSKPTARCSPGARTRKDSSVSTIRSHRRLPLL
ncbi:MAG: hypothetical protein DMF87_18785 [Acidobacteria bacterium]|nr:MAG: hypothetical protein DMF87_18785 [Acidobacteriota bacterium]